MAILKGRRKANSVEREYGIDRRKDIGFYIYSRILITLTIIIIVVPILYIFSLSLRTKATIYQDFLFLIPKAVTFQNYIEAIDYAKVHLNVSAITGLKVKNSPLLL